MHDIAVIGAGAAGSMAALKAGELCKNVLLLERNSSLGKKILLTGNHRCNITNTASTDILIKAFKKSGKFLRNAFFHLTHKELLDFFENKGLKFKTEEGGKIFPVTDKARSVVLILEQYLRERKITAIYNAHVSSITRARDHFLIKTSDNIHAAKRLILATGGASYPATGSDGSGALLAQQLGHTLIPFTRALVPLKIAEAWVKDLQGLSLQNIRVDLYRKGKRLFLGAGDILFTHFGLSGPLVIDLSADILYYLKEETEAKIMIDLLPQMNAQMIDQKFIDMSGKDGSLSIGRWMSELFPKWMAFFLLSQQGIKPEKFFSQITKKERRDIINMLKAFPLTITGSLAFDHAMATNGGIPVDEINQRTMGSKLVTGLYFAGEIIDGRGPSGGYNLHQAFATGALAGESAAKGLSGV